MNDALGSPQSVLVLGGTSEIARATLRTLIARRCRTVVLAGRDQASLNEAAIEARNVGATKVETVTFDALQVADATRRVDEVFDRHGDIDLVLVAAGVLGDQEAAEKDPTAVGEILTTNFTGPASAMLACGARATGSWLCCRRWPVSGPGGPTSCTARRRPAWTPSPRVCPTRWWAPERECSSSDPASCTPG
ncbi:MAG TPA: SDR family NAD(P)-dependent oxidoreductase [Acidimicrobiales bacterium]